MFGSVRLDLDHEGMVEDSFQLRVEVLDADFRGLLMAPEHAKEALQEPATRLAGALQTIAGADRRVKVVIRLHAVGRSGWVSL